MLFAVPMLIAISVAAAVIGMGAAWVMYSRDSRADKRLAASMSSIYPRLQRAYDVDALYDYTVVQPVMRGSESLWQDVDVAMIDGAKTLTESDPEVSEAVDFVEFYSLMGQWFQTLPGLEAQGKGWRMNTANGPLAAAGAAVNDGRDFSSGTWPAGSSRTNGASA